jgi:hypothetical protein
LAWHRLLEESKSGKQALREVRAAFSLSRHGAVTDILRSLARWRLASRACSSSRAFFPVSCPACSLTLAQMERIERDGGGRCTSGDPVTYIIIVISSSLFSLAVCSRGAQSLEGTRNRCLRPWCRPCQGSMWCDRGAGRRSLRERQTLGDATFLADRAAACSRAADRGAVRSCEQAARCLHPRQTAPRRTWTAAPRPTLDLPNSLADRALRLIERHRLTRRAAPITPWDAQGSQILGSMENRGCIQ